MGIKHENVDVGAEMDIFEETIAGFNSIIISDVTANGIRTIEYVSGEGDPPFGKFRLSLEAIDVVSEDEFNNLKSEAEKAA